MRKKAGRSIGRTIGRTILVFFITVLMIAAFLIGVITVVFRGPSTEARRLLVLSCKETSALKFVPNLFLSDEIVDSIVNPVDNGGSNPDVLPPFTELPFEDGTISETSTGTSTVTISTEPLPSGEKPDEWLTVENIKGPQFKGKLMTIKDPSKVIVGTLDAYGAAYHGLYLAEFIEKYGAIAGTNAGGFYDPNGNGNGGTPDGLVIRNGAIAWGDVYTYYNNVIGFDANHILLVGNMTGQEALNRGMQSAVSFSPGPVLVADGILQTNLGGGLNPRTCIGQCSDGTILLMVIEGRKPDSMGATYDDIAKILYERGAVNAANLDGGSSSLMYYNGEQITRGSNIVGKRQMSTAILVLQ